MRRPGGYAVCVDPDKPRPEEIDTFTCRHCGKVVHCIDPVTKRMASPYDLGGLCYQCNGMICADCVGKECRPLMKRIEAMEARERLFREMG